MGTDWMTERQRNGGIDRVPLPADVPGELQLCGKHVIGAGRFTETGSAPGSWSTIVCLCQRYELEHRYPEYVAWLDGAGDHQVWWPIADLHAPDVAAMVGFVDSLVERLRAGERLLVHCAAGLGRAGTTAVCILIRLGVELDEAVRAVAAARPMAGPETGAQNEVVLAMASAT